MYLYFQGVNPMSQVLLRDLSLIDYVKNSGLILFTWGEDNNNADVIDKLKKLKVDAIIYDRYELLVVFQVYFLL
jgi:glycerophosphoryl diester phosphodiesterase